HIGGFSLADVTCRKTCASQSVLRLGNPTWFSHLGIQGKALSQSPQRSGHVSSLQRQQAKESMGDGHAIGIAQALLYRQRFMQQHLRASVMALEEFLRRRIVAPSERQVGPKLQDVFYCYADSAFPRHVHTLRMQALRQLVVFLVKGNR